MIDLRQEDKRGARYCLDEALGRTKLLTQRKESNNLNLFATGRLLYP